MTRKQRRMERIRAVEREYLVALVAARGLDERLRADPSALVAERLEFADYRNFRDNLEATYLIRLFAEFEAGLREAWELAFRRTTGPSVRDLIDSLACPASPPRCLARFAYTASASIATASSTKGVTMPSPSGCARRAAICAASSAACPIIGNRPRNCGRHTAAPAEESRPCPWKTTC